MRLWPSWPRPELREHKGGKDYTEQATQQIVAEASGAFPDARALAVLEIVAGTFERALALGMVKGPGMFAEALQPHLGNIARELARRGEWAALIEVPGAGGGVRLVPAASWDVRGNWNEGDWFYRLDLFGPSGNITRLAPSAAVVHVRINTLADRPWHGRSALASFPATASLAARIEGLLATETRVPIGRSLTVNARLSPEQSTEAAVSMAKRRLSVLGAAGATESGARLHQYGPDPSENILKLRDTLRAEILAAYGLAETIFAPNGDGTAQREAWRRAGTSFRSYAAAIIREARAKLAPALDIDLSAVATADVQGRSRAFKALTDAGMEAANAAHNAGLEA